MERDLRGRVVVEEDFPSQLPPGLLPNSPYGVLDIIDGCEEDENLRLVRLRNPYSYMTTWNGTYADKDGLSWKKISSVEKVTAPGTFWMSWADFQKVFGVFSVCRLFPKDFCRGCSVSAGCSRRISVGS